MASTRFARGFALTLPLIASLAFSTGCPEEKPPARRATLTVTIDDAVLDRGQNTTVLLVSKDASGDPNTDAITITIKPQTGDELAGGIGEEPTVLTDGPLTVTPDAKGEASFVFGCNSVGSVDLLVVTGDVEKTEVLRCREAEVAASLTVRRIEECARLQADGASTCEIQVQAQVIDDDGLRVPLAGRAISVEVNAATFVANPVVTGSQFSVDEVLVEDAEGQAQSSIVVNTDDNGVASFLVRSPEFGLEELVDLQVSIGGATQQTTVRILPFVDRSTLSVIAAPTRLSSGETTSLTITATSPDGLAAEGRIVEVLSLDGATFVDEPGVVDTDNDGESAFVVLGPGGTTVVDVVAPPVDETEQVQIQTRFQPIAQVQVREVITDLEVTVAGSVNINVAFDVARIRADEDETATLSINAVQGQNPFNDLIVTVRVAQQSRALVRITDSSGDEPFTDDLAVVDGLTDGEAELTVAAENRDARGLAEVEVTIINREGVILEAGRKLKLEVQRDARLQSIVFVSSDPSVIGVQGSALQASSVVTFLILDDGAQPMPGVQVEFQARSSDPGATVVATGIANGLGIVSTVFSSGSQATPATVFAQAEVDGTSRSSPSAPINVVAGLPNSANSFLLCDRKAVVSGFSAECTANLVDRFTNRTTQSLDVQFRAEGGNIDAIGDTVNGQAEGTFITGEPGVGSSDIRDWSYGLISRLPPAQAARFAGCFDATTTTACDLIALCSDADPIVQAFCPLPPDRTGAAPCVESLSAETLSAIADEAVDPIGYEIEAFTNLDTRAGLDVDSQLAAYRDEFRTCGIALSCLQASREGLSTIAGADDCPLNLGCLDFSGVTECPQTGLLAILASVRGEEGFVDVNGNGLFDGVDTAIDYPEPFLDKNGNCSFDELNDSERLAQEERIRLSDIFIDANQDGAFGFEGAESNGVFDADTEIFLTTTILQIEGQTRVQIGEIVDASDCGAALGGRAPCSQPATGAATSACRETARGDILAEECRPTQIRVGERSTYGVRWSDSNGNCPSPDFEIVPTIVAFSNNSLERAAALIDLDFARNAALSEGECGVSPGDAAASNVARPWCEEHPDMGAPVRTFSVTPLCRGFFNGPEDLELRFTDKDTSVDGTGDTPEFSLGDVRIRMTVLCPLCGDGAVEGDEVCDDGNRLDFDGCERTTCTVEPGYTCVPAPDGSSDCTSTCGDGSLAKGDEDCDDDNTDPGDGCAPDCTVEAGFTCTDTPGDTSACTPA